MQDLRRDVKRRHGLASVTPLHAGVMVAVQRFRSDLGLYVHLHCLVTDGVFEDHGEAVRFLPADPPTPARMTAVLAQVHEAVLAADADDDLDMDPTLRACVQRSLAGPHLAPVAEPVAPPPLTMSAFGMQLHAATTVDGRDRQQLERLCRYLLRPPFAHDAVQALEGGRVRVHFKAPWRRGIAHADMDKDKFLARLCALVPPPNFHMVRYFGVLASHHHLRPRVVPGPGAELPGQQLSPDLVQVAVADQAHLADPVSPDPFARPERDPFARPLTAGLDRPPRDRQRAARPSAASRFVTSCCVSERTRSIVVRTFAARALTAIAASCSAAFTAPTS